MSLDLPAVVPVGAPLSAGLPRVGPPRRLLLIDDPRPAEAVLATAATATVPPHYYLSQIGVTYRLLADERADPGAPDALVTWLERPLGADYSPAQQAALDRLRAAARAAYGIGEAASPPAAVLGMAAGTAPPPDLLEELLGSAPGLTYGDGRFGEALWTFLYDLTWRARAGSAVNLAQAFPLHAARFDLGAPCGRNRQLTSGGQVYNYIALARDTIYNLGQRYREVQALSALLPPDGSPPRPGTPARALLDATYAAAASPSNPSAPPFDPNKRFHLEALRARLGPPLGRDGFTADRAYIAQVFAGDTLYAPASSQAEARFLSRTSAADPAYAAIWAEAYRRIGATYDPGSPFQRLAVQERLGMPLAGITLTSFEGVSYRVQVFAYDTLFSAPDGVVRRLGTQEEPEAVRRWTPADPAGQPWQLEPPRPGDPSWPRPPGFSFIPTTGNARERLFGRLEWQRVTHGQREIVITNDWAARNLVTVQIPQLAAIPGGGGGRVRFHRIAADQLLRLWRAWANYGLLSAVLRYDGDFVPRTIGSDPRQPAYNVLSNHAYGAAFDINARWNGYGVRPALVGQEGSVRELVQLANIHGFYWGGHWPAAVQDGMHFEWAREG